MQDKIWVVTRLSKPHTHAAILGIYTTKELAIARMKDYFKSCNGNIIVDEEYVEYEKNLETVGQAFTMKIDCCGFVET